MKFKKAGMKIFSRIGGKLKTFEAAAAADKAPVRRRERGLVRLSLAAGGPAAVAAALLI